MSKNTRRDFVKQAAVGTVAFLGYPGARVLGANQRVRPAIIRVGSRGQSWRRTPLDLRGGKARPWDC